MSVPTVRKATENDAEAFAACQLACWRETYTNIWGAERLAEFRVEQMAERRRREIQAETADYLLAELDGDVVGIAVAGPGRDDSPPAPRELYAIYVRRGHQGSGVADDLMKLAVAEAPAFLWVYRDNSRASAFYVHHDFIPDGEERLDSEGISEIRMIRR